MSTTPAQTDIAKLLDRMEKLEQQLEIYKNMVEQLQQKMSGYDAFAARPIPDENESYEVNMTAKILHYARGARDFVFLSGLLQLYSGICETNQQHFVILYNITPKRESTRTLSHIEWGATREDAFAKMLTFAKNGDIGKYPEARRLDLWADEEAKARLPN